MVNLHQIHPEAMVERLPHVIHFLNALSSMPNKPLRLAAAVLIYGAWTANTAQRFGSGFNSYTDLSA